MFSSLEILPPGVVCTQSYFVGNVFDTKEEASNFISYLKSKLVRFLVLQALTSQHLSRDKFVFVPIQDFSIKWTDEMLYKKYNISADEIAFIDSMIRSMEEK